MKHDEIKKLRLRLGYSQQEPEPARGSVAAIIPRLNFEGDPEAVKKAGSISWRVICLNQ
jgi:hypothetical protein